MKKGYIVLALLLTAIIFSGCREISVETIINSDGSFTRLITITGDSSDVIKKNLPYPIDNSWTSSFEKDSTEKDKFIQKYTKHFENDILLNSEIQNDTSWWKHIMRSIQIAKSSGFFYSYITYTVSYIMGTSQDIPWTKQFKPSTLICSVITESYFML